MKNTLSDMHDMQSALSKHDVDKFFIVDGSISVEVGSIYQGDHLQTFLDLCF